MSYLTQDLILKLDGNLLVYFRNLPRVYLDIETQEVVGIFLA